MTIVVARVAMAVALCVCALPALAACGDTLGAAALVASAPSGEVAFRSDPAKIAVSKHFALDIVVCPKAGAKVEAMAVDAHMPEHRHGMNYQPSLAALGSGRYRAEGLLFHMPGTWEFRFDLRTAGGRERALRRVEIP